MLFLSTVFSGDEHTERWRKKPTTVQIRARSIQRFFFARKPRSESQSEKLFELEMNLQSFRSTITSIERKIRIAKLVKASGKGKPGQGAKKTELLKEGDGNMRRPKRKRLVKISIAGTSIIDTIQYKLMHLLERCILIGLTGGDSDLPSYTARPSF